MFRRDSGAAPALTTATAAVRPAGAVGRRLPVPARVALAAGFAVVALLGYLFTFVTGSFEFAVGLRLGTAAAMVIAGFTQGVATVLFHTVTDNRILTPSIMGFDSLFVLMQTVLVFVFGGMILVETDGLLRLVVQTAAMVAFATLLYRWLFTARLGSIYVLLLVGVVLGLAFSSTSTFLERLLSPSDYDMLSVELFGRMTDVDPKLLPFGGTVCVLCGVYVWWRRRTYDALLLGRDVCTALGVAHKRELTGALLIIALLVALSTALVGPLTFFGFVIATLAYQLTGTHQHGYVLPMAVLLGIGTLAGGQFVMQHIFYTAGFLTVIIEVVGGIAFLAILLRRRRM